MRMTADALFFKTDLNDHLALFSLRTESDNPDTTCELSP